MQTTEWEKLFTKDRAKRELIFEFIPKKKNTSEKIRRESNNPIGKMPLRLNGEFPRGYPNSQRTTSLIMIEIQIKSTKWYPYLSINVFWKKCLNYNTKRL